MFLGRLLPICVLWWMALTTRDADVAVVERQSDQIQSMIMPSQMSAALP
jgi:hypothetical protein